MKEIKQRKERRFLKTLGRVGEILVEQVLLKLGSSIIKKIGGKKTLPSILFLLASLSLFAQFPNTGNKQRLGFQTTADGLVWRGALSDTASIQPINNQNAWVILDTVNLKMYSFDFTSNVWNLVGGAQGLTMPFDSITFNTAKNGTVGVGEVEYNDTQGSLIQGLKGGNVTNVIGQQLHQRVNNRTGAPLAKGDVVYLAGSQGNRITVAKGLAVTDAFSANTFGVVAESIADNASGFIITEGLITGLNTSALTEDSAVYLSPTVAGALTSTKPQAPQHSVYIGVCVKSNNGSGELFVKIRNGQELDELHDVRISSPVDRASLYYKLSEKLWRDTTAALLVSDTASMLLPYLRDADTVTLSNRINLKLNIADTSAFARDNQISGTSGQVAYFNSSSSVVSDTALRWSAANKSLGINMTTVPSGANLIIKNSQEPVNTTVVATQTFAADTTNWTRGAGWTFNGGLAVATAATGALTYTPAITITNGNAYEVTYTISGYTSGTLTMAVGNTSYVIPSQNVTNNKFVLLPTSATGGFRFTTSTFNGNLDNVSVVQIANLATILFAGQDDGSSILYNPLIMPNSSTLAFGGGGKTNTGVSNNFFGPLAGEFNTTGFANNFYGNEAGRYNISGRQNNFFGNQAGFLNTIGFGNNFFGNEAGRSNFSGNSNNFFGNTAGRNNVSGSENNFFGIDAGRNNISGSSNNFFGNSVGINNVTGSFNNFFGHQVGFSNTSGISNSFFGIRAGRNNTEGSYNNFFGESAGFNTTLGLSNVFIGYESGLGNTVGNSNIGIGENAGQVLRRGSNNIAIGRRAIYNTIVADTLTGSNNIAIGTNAADNIRAEAAGNVAIGNAVDLPTNNGSNQGVYQNVLFFTGASGTGTTIAAASKAGIKTNAPNRDLEVAGEVRITDLTTDTPTRLVGADADGDLGQVTLGAGLSLASSSLLADTSFLVTRFDTAAMLTPYFRDVDTVTLSNRINAKLNISDTTNMLVPYLRKADTTSMLLPYFRDADTTSLNLTSRFAAKLNLSDTASMLTNYLRTGTAASTYLPLTGGTLTGTINRQDGSHDGSTSTFYYNILNYFARQDNIKINPTAQITFTDRPGTLTFPNNVRTSDIHLMTARSFNGTSLGQYLDTTLSVVANQDGGRIGISKLNPNYKLDVNGTFNASGNSLIGGTLGVTGATTITGNVGIGINSSTEKLHIFNNAGINPSSTITKIETSGSTLGYAAELRLINNNTSGRTYAFTSSGPGDSFVGSSNLGIVDYTANAVRLLINSSGNIGIGTITPNAKLEVHGSAVFNEGAADADFRVESVGNAHMVFVDASTDRVGIGYASPTKTLDVNGEVRINTVTATPTSLLGKDGSNVVGEVTTVAQTGLMKSGGTTANTSSVGIITVAHGLSYTPSQVIATISQQNSYVIVCHSKDATNLSFTVYDSVTGNPLNNVSVGFFWLAIK